MGVRKFRSVEEMPGPANLAPLDPENLRMAFGLASLTSAIAPWPRRPGVRRFHDWGELLKVREETLATWLRNR
jgi:hypothetical protein